MTDICIQSRLREVGYSDALPIDHVVNNINEIYEIMKFPNNI